MLRYICERFGQALITLLALSGLVFLSVHLSGDPAYYVVGREGTHEDYLQVRKSMGLDKPLRHCHEITCSLLHAQIYLMGDS